MSKKQNIVIIGGGFAGVRTALDLAAKNSKLADFNIILIDKNSYHTFTPWLYERATAGARANSIKIPFSKIFYNKPVKIIKNEVLKINKEKNEITLKNKQKISYRVLVLAYGAKTSDFSISGINSYALALKTYDDAEKIRTTITQKFKNFIGSKKQKEVFEIVVGGGGFTGVEFASQLHSFMKSLAKKWELGEGSFEIKIIEGSDNLVGSGGAWTSYQVKKRLGVYRRIVVLLQSKIKKVTKDSLYLTNGDIDKYDVFIWTGGVEGGDLAHNSGLELSAPKSKIITQPTLRQKGADNIFSVGDCAKVFNPKTKAQSKEIVVDAYRQGSLAAKNILRYLTNKPLLEFDFKEFGFALPIRGHWGVSTVFGLKIAGPLAWHIASLIHLRYFLMILPPVEAIKRWRGK